MPQSQIETGTLGHELAQARFSRLYREQGRAAKVLGIPVLPWKMRRQRERGVPPPPR